MAQRTYAPGSIVKPWARGIEREPGGGFRVIRVSYEGTARYLSGLHAAYKDALDDLFQPYAWPGGYPVIATDADGDHLCMACARKEFAASSSFALALKEGRASIEVFEGASHDHGAITCDECGAVLIAEEDGD